MNKPPKPLSPATATVSLGKPDGHSIESILQAAANSGLKGIEICYNNLFYHAVHLLASNITEVDQESLIQAAKDVRRICNDLDLTIINLQPFASYDGLIDTVMHEQMVQKFSRWLELVHALGTDIIQMPSNFDQSGTTGDMDKIVADLVEVADLAAKEEPIVRIAYEAIGWGAHIDLWEQSWDVVKRVDQPNFGLCLDTFHIAGRVWADPASETGKTPNADTDLAASMSRLVKELDLNKVFYVQLSDAERMASPLIEGHEFYHEAQPPRMSWSRNARLFPFEEDQGGYMPIVPIARAIVNELGYRGWISMEIFSRHLLGSNPGIPAEYAERAMISYSKVREELGWDALCRDGV